MFEYQQGYNDRLKRIRTVVRREDLGQGTSTNPQVRDFAGTMGRKEDDAGHAIGRQLGGPGAEWNIFPQIPRENRSSDGIWRIMEDATRKVIEKNGCAFVERKFRYNDYSTRPIQIRSKICTPRGERIWFDAKNDPDDSG